MVRVTLERFECDECGEDGERYTLSFPDGLKVLDRCGKHNKAIFKLRDGPGDWTPRGKGNGKRSGIELLTPQEIAARRNK